MSPTEQNTKLHRCTSWLLCCCENCTVWFHDLKTSSKKTRSRKQRQIANIFSGVTALKEWYGKSHDHGRIPRRIKTITISQQFAVICRGLTQIISSQTQTPKYMTYMQLVRQYIKPRIKFTHILIITPSTLFYILLGVGYRCPIFNEFRFQKLPLDVDHNSSWSTLEHRHTRHREGKYEDKGKATVTHTPHTKTVVPTFRAPVISMFYK